ncbi:MAG: mechanosensitive ion channel family protein [Proteobacteria bacterium]|nr:mechanosensitive ion channel family protein [Pseudomonadota bacterium]
MRRFLVSLVVIFFNLIPASALAQDMDAAEIVKFIRPSGLVAAFAAIVVAMLALRFINGMTDRFSDRFSDRRLLAQQLNTILRFIIYIITITVVVSSVVRLQREAILALSGVIAVTVGFALKDLASSVLAGITILFDRPFQVGDRVTVAGQYGEITAIGLRSVRMLTLDDSVVTIPNNRFLTEVVVSGNAGALDMQIVMDFYVAIDSDIGAAKRVIFEAVRTSRFVYLAKPVVVLVKDVIQTSYLATRLRAKAYVLDVHYEKAFESDVTERVKQAFLDQSIRPPSVMALLSSALPGAAGTTEDKTESG